MSRMRRLAGADIDRRTAKWACAAILLVAAVARACALSTFAIHHPDEAFQYIEQAHRLVFGYGLVPWEYRYGMRSWLVPLLLAGPMKLTAGAPWPEPVLFARIPAALIAFAAVPAAWAIGRPGSRLHGVIAMAVAGLWFESIYFSVHVLTEVLATATFLSAAAFLLAGGGKRSDIAGGALMALAVILRFHYGPAAAVFVLMTLRLDRRRWKWLVVGAIPVLGASAAVDMAMGQTPFGWIVENFRQNIVRDRATEFGVAGPFAYLDDIWTKWSVAVVPIALFAGFGARRHPALAAAAIVNLLIHMAIAHKEYRFIFLTTQIVLILAAIGSVDYLRRVRPSWSSRAVGGVLLGGWLATSLVLGLFGRGAPDWRANEAGYVLATMAGRDPATCGIAYQDMGYGRTGGYAFIHRRIPVYFPVWQNEDGSIGFSAAGSPGWNTLFALRRSPVPAGYRPIACRGPICLYRRPGGCKENAAARYTRIQTVLEREDY